ncbi:ATPase [Butyrivibrio sp.]|uniref:ATPase n=1 Tax=Butyrivibrio sp. TaxID=28121 RepID=UPI0025BCE0C8|nr:ATPase [Butyrivibrio sp.]MBQ9302158.1 ATPase [Butyrivibrio sp.]
MKKYTIVAGVNGARKTTLYDAEQIQKSEYRVNADEILVEAGGDWRNASDVMNAGRTAVERLKHYIEDGVSFNQETTLCGNSILNNIAKARDNGYLIEVHYIGLSSAELAKERVAKRVADGGHGVSEADIERRYEQSFRNLIKIIPICNLVALYDNTEGFRRFAIYKDGVLVRKSHKVPDWFEKVCI